MAHTPTPWAVEDADGTNNHQHCKVYDVVDSKGKTIADCQNSEVADIQCDPDEKGSNCWDEQGRQDLEFIVLACNNHDTLVAALNKIASWDGGSEVNGRFDSPHEARIAREALATLKGAK